MPNIDDQTRKTQPVPYLIDRPKVVPIDVGRQLFVDDFLIESTTLVRTFHQPIKYSHNPILKPETTLERGGDAAVACPFSDGVFYDSKDKKFKMWYHAGWMDGTAYATSDDGISWVRPNLDIEPNTNRVIPFQEDFKRDGVSVWIDEDSDPNERFKMYLYARSQSKGSLGRLLVSADGIHWKFLGNVGDVSSDSVDNTTLFYNPFRKKMGV